MEHPHLAIHQDNQQSIHLNHPKHIEELCRHIFKDSPKGMSLTKKAFEKAPLPIIFPPKQPMNRLMGEPYHV